MKHASLRRAISVIVVAGAAICLHGVARAELPQIDGTQPFRCLHDGDNRMWRVQCTPPEAKGDKVCLYAPDSELSESGEWIRKLARARPCYDEGGFDMDALAKQGYRLQPARADSPYGWARDEHGRVMQVIFDLHRRLYVGVSWSPGLSGPLLGGGNAPKPASVGADFELFEYEYYHPESHGEGSRHRVAVGRGVVDLAPFSANAVAFHYDLSRRYSVPLLRITFFWPHPWRYDLKPHIGAWVEAGGLEVHHAATGDESLWRLATAQLTWDLLQSRDMYSYLRLRGGLGVERTYAASPIRANDRDAITPAVALDANVTLDEKGFHHVTGLAQIETPRYGAHTPAAAGKGDTRLKAELGYEVIFMAWNDQPLTLRLATGASWRDDIPGVDARWAFTATAGVRISFWAPARRH